MEAIIAAAIAAVVPFLLSLFGTHRAEKEDKELQQIAHDLGLKHEAQQIQERRENRLKKNANRNENYFRTLVLYVYLGLILIGALIWVGYYWVRTTPHDPAIIWGWVVLGGLIILAGTSLAYIVLISFGAPEPPAEKEGAESVEASQGGAAPLPAPGVPTSATPDKPGGTHKIEKT